MRHMSFALTTPQVHARAKTVTRRIGWQFLKPGDLLQPVEKVMGFKKGETMTAIGGPIRVVSVSREPLSKLTSDPEYGAAEVVKEGFGGASVGWFIRMFCDSHRCFASDEVTRIEFTYVD